MMKWSFSTKSKKCHLKGYYREGVALQCLGKKVDALASYAAGLAQDPKNPQLLQNFIDTSLEPPIKERFGPLFGQLQKMKLDQSAFVVISVVGQDLLSAGYYAASTVILEAALRIGTCSLKLRGSVFSALSSAHWGMANIDKAIACMQQDLAIAKSLGDQDGECRAHGNLGSAYFSKGTYQEALTHHRCQLVLAMRLKDRKTAATALSSLGHVYTAIADYANALASHKQCVLLMKQGKDKLQEAREIGNVGAVYLATGDFYSALECHNEHLKIAKHLGNKVEEARAYSNMGSAHHYKRDFEKAVTFHKHVLNIALELTDLTLEARAYAGLGHAARCMQDMENAKHYHEKQLDNAIQTKDKVAEGRACSNLGIIYHNMGEYDASLKLHKVHLQIAKSLGDRASQGRAYGNIGNCHSALKQFDLAIRFHKQELAISKEVSDKHSESSTHGNLAVAYQALAMSDKALSHYNLHLKMSQDLKDQPSEARALSNLGNHYCSRKCYKEAIPYYEQYLTISQELSDTEGEGKACHKLGYAHFCLGKFKEAVRYYEQDLALAKDSKDDVSMCRAYCNLGLARKALGDFDMALECQQSFLGKARLLKNGPSTFSALGNIGDIHTVTGQNEEAAAYFQQQLQLAKQVKDQKMEASALGHLGSVHRLLQQHDKSLGFHNQELQLYLHLKDLSGECRANGNLGNVHMTLGNYSNAYRCYEEQLDRSRELNDCALEAHAYGNLGITKINMGQFEDAIGLFEQQLAMLEQVPGQQAFPDRCRTFGNLGDCYDALGDFEEAVKCYEQQLVIAQRLAGVQDQDKAYRGLGNAHRAMGNLQQALVCFEKRLVIAHELDKQCAKSSAYGELGCLHSLLGNFEQAISCLQHQLRISQEIGDSVGEGEASCGLGGVYQQMGEFEKALEYHARDLSIAQEVDNSVCQCRAFGNLGLSHESLGDYEDAVQFQEQHLNTASQTGDRAAKTLALSSLGRVHHAMGNYPKAIQYLQQGLQIAQQLGRKEDEAKIRHRLGLALWAHGQLQDAKDELYGATELFECIRGEAQFNNDYKLSLFDLQTASYQSLQRVLVSLGDYEEALVVAERGRTRAFVDLLVERQNVDQDSWYSSIDSTPVTKEQIMEIVNRQKSAVLYYSIAAGYLYSWLIVPEQGIVKFHERTVSEIETGSDPEDTQSVKSYRSMAGSTSLLDMYVGQARESLGVESHLSNSRLSLSKSSCVMSETESEADDLWQQHLEELGDRLNAEGDRTGFLRMVNRNHVWNASSYSLGSVMSFSGSINGLLGPRSGSTRSRMSTMSSASTGKPPLSTLYELLIEPMEEHLPAAAGKARPDLVLVLQGDLYLIPFAVLKRNQAAPCLFERFNLMSVPSVRALQASHVISRHNEYNPNCTGAVVVGNPRLPASVTNMWQWGAIPASEQECRMVGEMLGTRSLTGADANKANVQQRIQKAELVHLATHVSWKLAAVVLSASDFSTTRSVQGNLERMDLSDTNSDAGGAFDGPPLCDFLLTAADVLNTKVTAKLVVLSSGHTDERAGRINADGVIGLTRAFLAAGAQCVLLSLWPLPELAGKIFLKAFYTAMLQGAKSSYALSEAMKTVQNSRQFSHPSNWASWMLIGNDVKLSSKVALMGHALCELLQTPAKSREAMRVVLHLVEKSLQRIHQGHRTAMYTTQASIENKVGDVLGWKDLLTSVGFRLEPSAGNIPAAVFFPTSDPGERLTQLSASLQALLGLAVPTLTALSKMIPNPDVGEAITTLMKDVQRRMGQEEVNQVKVPVRLWRAHGCHEFLASLGFDLVEVGKDEVTIQAGKSAGRRNLQFALQAMVAVFDTQEAPRVLPLDSCSSMESLCSTGSATSTSNFSKGSTPPTSPNNYRKKSFFNPAEVEKMPSVFKVPSTRKAHSRHHGSDPANQLALQNAIRQKYSSPSASDMSDTNPADEHLPQVIAVEPGEQEAAARAEPAPARSRVRGGLFERGSNRGFFPATPPNIYSTSASDSEDAAIPDNNLSRQQSRGSSLSLASQSSTLTQRSVGGGGGSGFRRTRARASATSTRSSASDRTITADSRSNSQENLVSSRENLLEFYSAEDAAGGDGLAADNLSDSGIHSKHTDTNTDNSGDGEHPPGQDGRAAGTGGGQEVQWFETGEDTCDSTNEADKPSFDPTAIAQKVMADTQTHKMKLDAMQNWSVQSLVMRRLAEAESAPTPRQSETVAIKVPVPAAKPPTTAFSSFKPVTPASVTQSPACAKPEVQTARSVTEELQSVTVRDRVDKLHFALGAKEKPPTKPKPILANSVYDTSFTMHSKDTTTAGGGGELDKPRSLAIIESQRLHDESWSEDDPDGLGAPLESILEEDEAARSVSEVAESSNIESTDTECEHVEHSGNQSSSSQDAGGVLKGAMKKPRSATTTTASGKSKSVKFEDEVMMKTLSNGSGEEVAGEAETPAQSPYEVKYAETRFIDKSGAVLSKSGPMVSTIIDNPHQNGVSGTGGTTAVHNVFVPNVPVPAQLKAQTVPTSPQFGALGFRQPPPPYPGNRRQGSQDSTSSRESGVSSSSRGSGSLLSWSSGTNSNNAPKVPLPNRPLQASPRGAGSAEEDDQNSPLNLQKASRQFYHMSSADAARHDGSFRNRIQGTFAPVDAHKPTGGGTGEHVAPVPLMGSNGVEDGGRGLGHLDSPPTASQSPSSPREWYQSDSDSVCSHADSSASSLRSSGRNYPGVPGSQQDVINRNMRNEWLESQNRLVAQQRQNRNLQGAPPYNSPAGGMGYQNLPAHRPHVPPPIKAPLHPPLGRNTAPPHHVNGNHQSPHGQSTITNGYAPHTTAVRPPGYQGVPRTAYYQGQAQPVRAPRPAPSRPGDMPPTSLLQSIDPGENHTEEVRYRDTVLQASKC